MKLFEEFENDYFQHSDEYQPYDIEDTTFEEIED